LHKKKEKARTGGRREKGKSGVLSSARAAAEQISDRSEANLIDKTKKGQYFEPVGEYGQQQQYQNDQYSLQSYEGGGEYNGVYGEYGEYDPNLSQSQTQVGLWDSDGGGSLSDWEQSGQHQGQQHVWQEHFTAEGTAYYYNAATAESSWEMPIDLDTQIETQNQDENGNWYWYNSITGESRWM
jgi:hypothetical protein